MPLLAVCPYCGQGKVGPRAHAEGRTAPCPNCYNCFTLVPSNEVAREQAHRPAPAPRAPAPAAAAPKPAPAASATATVPAEHPPPAPATRPTPAPTAAPQLAPGLPRGPRPVPADCPATELQVALPLALVALTLGGVSLVVSQLPYGRISTVIVAGLGLLVGLLSLLVAERKRLVPACAAALNGAALLAVLVLPGWLGLTTWLPGEGAGDSGAVKAVGLDGGGPVLAAWVDGCKGAGRVGDGGRPG